MPNSNDNTFQWTVADIRSLDVRLSAIEASANEVKEEIRDIKEELAIKNHIVIDNTSKTDWKAVAAIITAIVGTIGSVVLSIWGSR